MLSSLKNRRKGNPFFLHRKPITPYFFHFQSAKGDWLPPKHKKEGVSKCTPSKFKADAARYSASRCAAKAKLHR